MKAHFSLIALLSVSLGSGSAVAASAKAKRSAKVTTAVVRAPAEEPSSPVVPAPPNSHPMEDLRKSHVKLQKLLGKTSPSWSPESDAKSQEIRQLVNSFLDFQELATRALSKHWDALPPAKRGEFVTTLRELVERNYIDQMSGGKASYKLTWGGEELEPTEAKVTATLNTTARGKPIEMSLEYRMVHKQRGWVVYDVVTDEQSLLETYRSEFNKVIKKESFDALLEKLKQKLAEKREIAAAKTK